MGTIRLALSRVSKAVLRPSVGTCARPWRPLILPVVLAASLAGAADATAQDAAPPDAAKPIAHCEVRPLPTRRSWAGGSFDAFQVGVDRGGTLYASARRDGTHAWNGTRFEPVMMPGGDGRADPKPLAGGQLIGGFDRGLYVVQEVKAQSRLAMYRLDGGKASIVSEIDAPPGYSSAHFFVSRSGLIVHWSYKGLTVFASGVWRTQEMDLDDGCMAFLDDGQTLFVFHDDRLCRVDKDGQISLREFPTAIAPEDRGRWRDSGVLWGSRLLFVRGNTYRRTTQLLAYDLATGKDMDVSDLAEALHGRGVDDMFAGANGYVWLWIKDARGYGMTLLTPEGDLFDIEGTATLDWGNTQTPYQKRVRLTVGEAGFWIGQPHGGLATLDNGRMQQFGWRDGIGICRSAAVAPDGTIYAADDHSVHVFRRGEPADVPNWTAVWDEYTTSPLRPVRDSAGSIWVSLVEDLETMSLWDGTKWKRLKLPFNMGEAQVAVADDMGHVIIQMLRPEDDCLSYDVSPEGTERFDTVQAALEAAVERGASRFDRDALVDDDGTIWMRQDAVDWLYRFDHGKRQIMISDNGRIRSVARSVEHGIVAQDDRSEFYAYQDGDLRKIAPKPAPGSRWLLGRNGLQPLEAKLYDAAPDDYVVLDYANDGYYYLAVPRRRADGTLVFERGDRLPRRGAARLSPSVRGGSWCVGAYSMLPVRVFGGRAIQLKDRDSPLKCNAIHDVLEDRAGNLWIDAGVYGGPYSTVRHVFVKRMAAFHVEADEPPARAGRSLRITARVMRDEEPQDGWRLFYRLDDGDWQGGDPTPNLTIAFPEDGTYHLEVIGMGPLGGTTPESLKFTIESRQ